MTFLNYIVDFGLNFNNPVVLTHLGLATVHVIAAQYYLDHAGGRPLACCSGLASAFYILLAYLHGLPH